MDRSGLLWLLIGAGLIYLYVRSQAAGPNPLFVPPLPLNVTPGGGTIYDDFGLRQWGWPTA